MDIEAGLERCVIEVSGHILGVVVTDRQSAYFVATSSLSSSDDGREFASMQEALRTLHKEFEMRLYGSQRGQAAGFLGIT